MFLYIIHWWLVEKGTSAMNEKYMKHLTLEDREKIQRGIIEGISKSAMVKIIGKDISEGTVTNMPEDALVDPFTQHVVSDLIPIRKGYIFIGRQLLTTTLTSGNKLIIVDYDVELVAVWNANQHNLSYVSEGTVMNMPESELIDFGTKFTTSDTIPERVVYNFVEWELWSTLLDKDAKLTISDEDVELIAVWEKLHLT